MINVEIEGPPKAAARPRVTRTHTYNPQRDLIDEMTFILKSQYQDVPHSESVSLEITFFMPIPQSYSKKNKTLLPGKPHCFKPDLDNLIKLFNDAANNVLFADDSLISSIKATKIYSNRPRTVAKILTHSETQK